jgi:N-acetylneuraminic acid mutarotase
MAYDDDAGRMILFGGFAGKLLADTWSYDSAKNTWTKLRTAGSPGPRVGASMFYDATLHRLVMTGGQVENPAALMFQDCWAFSYYPLPAN